MDGIDRSRNEERPETGAGGAEERPGDDAGDAAEHDERWRRTLTPEQYRVTRQRGTERAFTGRYWNCHEDGVYRCVCCGAELFRSGDKFDSGCGWPSFTRAAADGTVLLKEDLSHGMVRTEVVCAACDAHLGHVFDDGPLPAGQRYCINSASLDLRKKDEAGG